jgi:DNA-binding transcriptional LysR family regulator
MLTGFRIIKKSKIRKPVEVISEQERHLRHAGAFLSIIGGITRKNQGEDSAMNIRYMREYLALAENLNFTETAEQLYIAQSNLSRHLLKIEEVLDTKLIVRTTHEVILTESGKRTLEEFKKIVATYDALVNELSRETKDYVLLGVLYYAIDRYLTPLLEDFASAYPNINISVSSYQPLQLANDLISDKIEVGLFEAGDCNTNHLLKSHTISKEKLAILVSSDHIFASMDKVSLKDLANQTLVFMRDNRWLSQRIMQYLSSFGLEHYDIQYSDHIDTLAMKIIETNGIAIVPEHLESMKRNRISLLPLDDDLSINLCLVHKKSNTNPSIKLLINTAKSLYN